MTLGRDDKLSRCSKSRDSNERVCERLPPDEVFSERISALGAALGETPPPVCVTGMHRSGTSTVAQLLGRSGLHLGEEGDLFAASAANPDGYWENKRFVEVNEGILRTLGGGWDLPPSPEPGWQHDDDFLPYREAALGIIGDLEDRVSREYPWGWKDPRNCLTLPFWLDLLPGMKVVLCVRNPTEVALSIRQRGSSSMALGLNLWKIYNQAVLDALPEEQCLVTHYESYFYRPQAEMRRVLDFANVSASDQLVSLIRSRVIKGLRNHVATLDEPGENDLSEDLLDLYMFLCDRADWDPYYRPLTEKSGG